MGMRLQISPDDPARWPHNCGRIVGSRRRSQVASFAICHQILEDRQHLAGAEPPAGLESLETFSRLSTVTLSLRRARNAKIHYIYPDTMLTMEVGWGRCLVVLIMISLIMICVREAPRGFDTC